MLQREKHGQVLLSLAACSVHSLSTNGPMALPYFYGCLKPNAIIAVEQHRQILVLPTMLLQVPCTYGKYPVLLLRRPPAR